MKIKILLLLVLSLIFTNCNKEKHQIPDEYRSLIGEWQCYKDCVTPVEVEIGLNKLIVKRPMKRDLIVRYRSVKTGFGNGYGYRIYLDKHYWIDFYKSESPNAIDTIELLTNDIYGWKGASILRYIYNNSVLSLVRK